MGWMDGLDGSLGLVEYRAPYGANNAQELALGMRPRISDTASMPQRTGVKQPLTINVQSPPRGKRPLSSDSRVGEWTLRTNPYVYGI